VSVTVGVRVAVEVGPTSRTVIWPSVPATGLTGSAFGSWAISLLVIRCRCPAGRSGRRRSGRCRAGRRGSDCCERRPLDEHAQGGLGADDADDAGRQQLAEGRVGEQLAGLMLRMVLSKVMSLPVPDTGAPSSEVLMVAWTSTC
jgi:hypothetical protein